KSHP
ncbi:hypothetical protein D031_2648B, partial [Vibrio parahaemolyticus VP-48]